MRTMTKALALTFTLAAGVLAARGQETIPLPPPSGQKIGPALEEKKKEQPKKKEEPQPQTESKPAPDRQAPPQQAPKPAPQPQPQYQQPQYQQPQYQQPQYAPPEHQQPQYRDHRTPRTLPDVSTAPPRLSDQRQRQMIAQQKQRQADYDQQLRKQRTLLERRSTTLQRQNRMAQYRFQQRYLERLHQQQLDLQRHHDYDADPYFHTGPSYRYSRGGRYYEINEYAAAVLQDAVNYGYEQGFEAGAADRDDGWRSDYRNSYAYLDANYGYDGLYVSQSEYNYYFREGFRRGYSDGYYRRYRYGSEVDGALHIFTDAMRLILDLKALH